MDRETERERRTFWVYLREERRVAEAEGLSCADSDYWWFPTLGWSIPVSQCHEERSAAVSQGRESLAAELVAINKARESLR